MTECRPGRRAHSSALAFWCASCVLPCTVLTSWLWPGAGRRLCGGGGGGAGAGGGAARPRGGAVAGAAVAVDLDEALDVLADLLAELTFDGEVAVDELPHSGDLVVGEVAHLGLDGDVGGGAELLRRGAAAPIDVG